MIAALPDILTHLVHCRTDRQLRDELQRALDAHHLPLHLVGDHPWTLELNDGIPEPHLEYVRFFTASLNALRHQLHQQQDVAQLCTLALTFAGKGDFSEALQDATGQLRRILKLDSLTGLRDVAGTLQVEPTWCDGPPTMRQFTPTDLHLVREGAPVELDGGVLLPFPGQYRARIAFWMEAPARTWTEDELDLLAQTAHVVGMEYERVLAQRHLRTLLRLQASFLSMDPDAAYQPLLERAISLIPGAESGSLLIRAGQHFQYAATVNFDPQELQNVTFELNVTRDRWYGLGDDAWLRGTPDPDALAAAGPGVSYLKDGRPAHRHLDSVDTLEANIGVPILHHGQVYGFLNIDNHTDADVFGKDSLEVARTFAVQAAVLLHEAAQRSSIQLAARTDALTGLQNRRGFMEALRREVALAHRHGMPLAMLVADMRGFKAVNDTLGHTAGDEALIRVGNVLRNALRAGDSVFRWSPRAVTEGNAPSEQVFRWGGDEFAVLLPGTPPAGAELVKARLQEAVRRLQVGTLGLELNMGVATLQTGDTDGSRLVHEADAEMYREKHARMPAGR
ncbi:diguanylate cyclase domain-containing protein [Deinococcus malanensis]|uniref:sensor domain-containing diguanylate cyclase n=1 Tax=Deinococcus malanensis TaxID=1706855 RepID=UPI00363B6D56